MRRRRHKRGQHLRRAEGRHLSDQRTQRFGDVRNRGVSVRVGRCGEQHVLQQRLERGLHLRPCDQLLGLVAQHRVQENLERLAVEERIDLLGPLGVGGERRGPRGGWQ
jgi:hypothetical protein